MYTAGHDRIHCATEQGYELNLVPKEKNIYINMGNDRSVIRLTGLDTHLHGHKSDMKLIMFK